MHRITVSNAIILAESMDPYITSNDVHFKYHARNRRLGRMPGQLRQRIRLMQYSPSWHDYLYVSKGEMKGLFDGTGWHVSKFIDFEGYGKNDVYVAIISK